MDHLASLEKAALLISAGRPDKVTVLLLPVCASSDRTEQEAAYLLLINAALLEDDCRRAIDFSLKGLQAGLNSTTLHLSTAWAYHNAELYQQALKHLQVALQQEPQNSEVHVTLAQCYFNLAQYEMAEQHGRRATELSPEDQSPLTILAAIMQNKGKSKEALALVDKGLAIDSADSELLAMRALLEKDSDKSIELFRRVLSANPTDRWSAREYRQLSRKRFNRFDAFLFVGYGILNLALIFVPWLTDIFEPRLYLWLYLPGAWVLGRNWRLSLPFFLFSFGVHSQIPAVAFSHWTPMAVLVMSCCYTLIFWFLHLLADWGSLLVRNRVESFKLHYHQGTMKTKVLESFSGMINVDSTLVLLGSGSICLATYEWLPGWTAWFGLLPVLILFKHRGLKGLSFLMALAPIFYGDISIFLVVLYTPARLSLVLVLFLMVLQLYMFNQMYLRKVRYAYVR